MPKSLWETRGEGDVGGYRLALSITVELPGPGQQIVSPPVTKAGTLPGSGTTSDTRPVRLRVAAIIGFNAVGEAHPGPLQTVYWILMSPKNPLPTDHAPGVAVVNRTTGLFGSPPKLKKETKTLLADTG